MTDEELEERLNWAQAAGAHSAWNTAVGVLRNEAGALFASGKDEEAALVRSLANRLAVNERHAQKALEDYIQRDRKKRESNRG